MNPIATFSDSCFPHRQSVTLWADRLHVTGSVFLSRDYETTIPLAELSDMVSRSTGRSQFYQTGLLLVILFGFVTLLVFSFAGFELLSLLLICFASFLLGLVLCIIFARSKVEIVTFTNRQGVALLSVLGGTKKQQQFARFIQNITDTIRNQPKCS